MEKGSKLLRGNWVEAKATENLDSDIEVGCTTSRRVSKQGHDGLLTQDTLAPTEKVSSNAAIYQPLPPPPRSTGQRAHNRKNDLIKQVGKDLFNEIQDDMNRAPEATDYTTTQGHYQSLHPEYATIEHSVTKEHNFLADQPATFWHEQLGGKVMPGLTNVAKSGNPFHKDSKFSTPLDDPRTHIAQA